MEELKYSPEGVLCTRGPDQYKIPAVCDIPERFRVSLLSSSQNPYAIYASKVSKLSQSLILRSQDNQKNYSPIKCIYTFGSFLAFQTDPHAIVLFFGFKEAGVKRHNAAYLLWLASSNFSISLTGHTQKLKDQFKTMLLKMW